MSLMICWVIFFSIFTDLADGCGVTPAFASIAGSEGTTDCDVSIEIGVIDSGVLLNFATSSSEINGADRI